MLGIKCSDCGNMNCWLKASVDRDGNTQWLCKHCVEHNGTSCNFEMLKSTKTDLNIVKEKQAKLAKMSRKDQYKYYGQLTKKL